jgi:nucleoside-diphosphate-sugar epimerase
MATQGKKNGLTIALTGAAGYLASQTVEALVADDRVERILAFDVRPLNFSSPKVVTDQIDVRDPALEKRFAGADVVVHLAFIMDPIKDEREMRDVNVNGSQNVFKCAGKAGVGRVVYTSSAIVYGAHADNDVPLTEESPLRANLDFSYAAHKLETEYVVKELNDEFPDLSFTILRPAIVFGPHADNAWSHVLELPVVPTVSGYEPPMQFVHETDVARALRFAIFEPLDGAYNVAPDGWLENRDIFMHAARRKVPLPEPLAFQMAEKLWAAGMAEAPGGMLHYVMHPWVVSSAKIQAAGFRFEHSNLDAFLATAGRTRDRVRVGTMRAEKRDVFRGGLAGAGVLGGMLLWRGLRRRHA